MTRREALLTRANLLTLLRAAAAPVLAVAIVREAVLVSILCFVLAVLTDFVDGRVARRYGEQSPFGGLFDHATDALFVTAGLGALAHLGRLPVALPWIVAVAFLQYTLDSRATRGRALRSSPLGRWNGIAYFVILGIPLVQDVVGLPWPHPSLLYALGVALIVSTLLSMADRMRALWRARGDASLS